MSRHSNHPIPGLVQVQQDIEHWRQTRTKRGPMPLELWQSATDLAREHGVNPIARALGLGHDRLKRRVEGAVQSQSGASAEPGAFVELRPHQSVSTVSLPGMEPSISGVSMELSDPRGRSMVVRRAGTSDCDLVGLARTFWDTYS